MFNFSIQTTRALRGFDSSDLHVKYAPSQKIINIGRKQFA